MGIEPTGDGSRPPLDLKSRSVTRPPTTPAKIILLFNFQAYCTLHALTLQVFIHTKVCIIKFGDI